MCSYELTSGDRTNQQAVSYIELATRYTSTVWSRLHDDKVDLPPLSKWPAGVKAPSSSGSPPRKSEEASDNTTGKKAHECSETEVNAHTNSTYRP